MANKILNVRQTVKAATAEEWQGSSLVLLKNELAVDTTNHIMKIGDGSQTFENAAIVGVSQDVVNSLISEGAVQTVVLSSGTNPGTLKLTIDGTETDNIAVTGLGSAAFAETTDFATAAQGALADAAMPKAGGTFTGAVTLSGAPTEELHAATKKYVDDTVSGAIAGADAMELKGTVGTGGTSETLPEGPSTGDTYKVISETVIPNTVSYTDEEVTATVGDMIVAMAGGKWLLVPSGDEDVTAIRYSTTEQSLTTSYQTGNITVGEAATKQVDTTIDAASQSEKLPTSKAVAAFVEGKGYVTTDEKVKATPNASAKAYIIGTTSAEESTGTAIFNPNVFVGDDGSFNAPKFVGAVEGDVTGNADSATKLQTARDVNVGGALTATAASFDGTANATINVTAVNTDYLQNGADTLVLDCGGAEE